MVHGGNPLYQYQMGVPVWPVRLWYEDQNSLLAQQNMQSLHTSMWLGFGMQAQMNKQVFL